MNGCQFTTVETDGATYWLLRCGVCGREVRSTRPNYAGSRCGQLPQPPGLLGRAFNFAGAAVRHAAAGAPQASQETVDARLATCRANQCGYYLRRDDGVEICAHKSCGCPLLAGPLVVSKLRWAEQQCPVGLWQKTAAISGS